MSDKRESLTADAAANELSRRRILIAMFAVSVVIVAVAAFFAGGSAAAGVAMGVGISYLNYFWLDRSTRSLFASIAAGDSGSATFAAARYILRYAFIGGLFWLIYQTQALPIAFVIAGSSAFVLAVVVEGFRNIFKKV